MKNLLFQIVLFIFMINSMSCKSDKYTEREIYSSLVASTAKTACTGWIGGCLWRNDEWKRGKSKWISNMLNEYKPFSSADHLIVSVTDEGYFGVISIKRKSDGFMDVRTYFEAADKIRLCKAKTNQFLDSVRILGKVDFDSLDSDYSSFSIENGMIRKYYPTSPSVYRYLDANIVCID